MSAPEAKPRMAVGEFLLRLVSGAVLAAIALALTWWGPLPFAGLVLLVSAALCWEWGRIVRGNELDAALVVHLAIVVGAIALSAFGQAALGALAVLVGALVVAVLRFGGTSFVSALGVGYVGLPAVALTWLRADGELGLMAVLFVFAAVWATDTFAYFCGRLIGGPKLVPRVSPNKTWSGLLGGSLASAATGVAFATVLGNTSPAYLAILGLALALVSQMGDLSESALKRQYGVKDASHLIPGHGGFMDRVDGLIFAALAAGLLALLRSPSAPASALIGWP